MNLFPQTATWVSGNKNIKTLKKYNSTYTLTGEQKLIKISRLIQLLHLN
jgi:hypothetical protein